MYFILKHKRPDKSSGDAITKEIESRKMRENEIKDTGSQVNKLSDS